MFKRDNLCYNRYIAIYIYASGISAITGRNGGKWLVWMAKMANGVYKILYGAADARKMGEKALGKTLTFRRGVHPHEGAGEKRATGARPIEVMPAPALAAVPLLQHAGAPCKPLVKIGERVYLGQKVGEADGFVSAAVHAPVSGKVKGVQPRIIAGGRRVAAVLIENDGLDEWDPALAPAPDADDPACLLEAVRAAGVVGMGGATFPTHVKLSPPKDKPIDTVILNGAECEPFLSADHRVMIEEADAVVDGLRLAAKIVGAKALRIGVEDNKPDAAASLRKAAGQEARVCEVRAKYPQGSEKQLIQALTGRRVPSGGLPMDAGCVVINASTAAAISRAVRKGRPLIERVLTVDGEVGEGKNLRVRLGTEIGEAVACCGGAKEGVNKIVLGGPMMGQCAYDLHTPVTKGVSGILLFKDDAPEKPLGNCVRCGGCVNVCPVGLMPLTLYALARKGLYDRARDQQHLMDCIECGACAYQCPARLPLVQSIRAAKSALRRQQAR